MPTLRQLRALSLLAQTGSFTQAGEQMFVTQSAISWLIRELESEVGRQLVVRGRTVRLTSAGEHIELVGRRACEDLERATLDVREQAKWTKTVIRLAVGSLSAATFVPTALALLAKEDRGIQVELVDRPVALLQQILDSGEADVAIGSLPSGRLSAEYRSELLIRD